MKYRTIIIFTFVLAFIFLAGQPGLLSQEETKTTPPPDNEKEKKEDSAGAIVHEVVVQGDAVEQSATVTMITAEQLKQSNAATVAEALEMVPGSHVRVGGKGEAYIRLRGFRQREAAVLIDGVPVSSPYDGQLDLSNLPVSGVERIDIVKGAASVLYGANVMGGVINIITKKGGKDFRAEVTGQFGAGKNALAGASVQGALGKLVCVLSGTYTNQEYFPLSRDYQAKKNQKGLERENSHRESLNGRLGLNWEIAPRHKIGANVTLIDMARGIPHHESDAKALFWRFTDWKEGLFDFYYQGGFGKVNLESRFFYQYFDNVLNSYDDSTYSTQKNKNSYADTMENGAVGGDLFIRLSAGERSSWKAALRFRVDEHRRQSGAGKPWTTYKMNTFSLPLEGEWKPIRKLSLIYGASFDIMTFDRPTTGESKNTSAINPQLAMVYALSERVSLKGSATYKTRFPTMRELFPSPSGNPDLKPMHTTGFEGGVEFRPQDNLTFSVVAFYNDVRDLINRVKKDDPHLNIEKAVMKGIETELQWQLAEAIRLQAAYTYLQADDESGSSTEILEYRPDHKLDIGLGLHLPGKVMMFANVGYVSSQMYLANNKEMTLDPYTLADIRFSRKITDWVELSLTVRNLFDVNYYESEGYPREGRMVYIGASIGVN